VPSLIFYVYASVSEGEWACDRTCGTSRDSCHAHLSINHRPLDPLEYKTFWISVNDSLLSVGILTGRQAPRRSIVFARWSPTSPPLPQIRYIAVSNELSALNFALYRDIDVNECYVNETVTRVRSKHMNLTELRSELPDRGAEYCVDRVCLSLYVSVCYLSVCPRSYLRNKTSDLYQCFFHDTYVPVARSSSGGVAIRCVLPVLWMTSHFYTVARNRRRNIDSVGSSTDLTPWRILKLTYQGAAPDRGRSLISTIALSDKYRLSQIDSCDM